MNEAKRNEESGTEGANLTELLSGLSDKPRYDHVCRACGDLFSNIVKDCDLCCVCEVNSIRREWDR